MYATRSPRPTPIAWRADDHRSHRSKNSSYVRRRSPSTTPIRSPYSLRVRRANSRGVSGVSMCLLLRIQHQCKVGGPDAAHECVVPRRLELDGPLVDERVHVVEVPVAIALDPQPITKSFVLHAAAMEVDGARVDGLEDVELHAELGNGLRVALCLHQLLDLGLEVGDLLLVVVHPRLDGTAVQ